VSEQNGRWGFSSQVAEPPQAGHVTARSRGSPRVADIVANGLASIPA
jgi:hypothetical protein